MFRALLTLVAVVLRSALALIRSREKQAIVELALRQQLAAATGSLLWVELSARLRLGGSGGYLTYPQMTFIRAFDPEDRCTVRP
jgi:hypothetical protein